MGESEGRTGATLPVAPSVIFTHDARAEIIAAQAWYEEHVTGLGARFRAELDFTAQRIAHNPLQFPFVFHQVRRALLHRFPHYLLFLAHPNAATVIACFHPKRDPR